MCTLLVPSEVAIVNQESALSARGRDTGYVRLGEVKTVPDSEQGEKGVLEEQGVYGF